MLPLGPNMSLAFDGYVSQSMPAISRYCFNVGSHSITAPGWLLFVNFATSLFVANRAIPSSFLSVVRLARQTATRSNTHFDVFDGNVHDVIEFQKVPPKFVFAWHGLATESMNLINGAPIATPIQDTEIADRPGIV